MTAPKPAPRCVCLTGPTACGKTELALELAERLPVEIVSMDSAMVYRGLDIGTAKPSAAVRARVHRRPAELASLRIELVAQRRVGPRQARETLA